ncbi:MULTISPECIES: DUF1840 domain-containing protein [Marichromatium]|uniref:Uncharacterized protein DUF1840 n=1 Tax=Marichromatium gracile TaxID=1048 RepID=A0A4R4A5J7_MARGR|nr:MULTISPECIES: DUF1840 domain-containing protein [Marichromatium]MBK1709623.1 hypothetical protein [Marichromatium gracile]RNE90948.1 DUF1840 domain-containing protein [Marichromatium sp. AB31]RNE93360.1 DUF1840 domain-containing protein [Marichromatium sp. AB32]TCW34031.1 uncharacterized protein DUF1840 [Marichromatium gracile]
MLVHFQTSAYATITMFGEVAVPLIKLMGHSGSVPGALLAADVPRALERLRDGVADHPGLYLDPRRDEDDGERRHVSLAHRALPLIELLEAAAAAEANVMWDH